MASLAIASMQLLGQASATVAATVAAPPAPTPLACLRQSWCHCRGTSLSNIFYMGRGLQGGRKEQAPASQPAVYRCRPRRQRQRLLLELLECRLYNGCHPRRQVLCSRGTAQHRLEAVNPNAPEWGPVIASVHVLALPPPPPSPPPPFYTAPHPPHPPARPHLTAVWKHRRHASGLAPSGSPPLAPRAAGRPTSTPALSMSTGVGGSQPVGGWQAKARRGKEGHAGACRGMQGHAGAWLPMIQRCCCPCQITHASQQPVLTRTHPPAPLPLSHPP